MAFAFQLLLTNLGVALGLSALGWAFSPGGSKSSVAASLEAEVDSALEQEVDEEGGIPSVSHLLGAGVTLTLAPVLFATAFLATTFSGILQFLAGSIFGLILWAAYLLILIWISSITVSGILDFVLGTATDGIRRLFLGVAQVFQSEEAQSEAADDLQQTIEVLSAEIKQALAGQQELPVLLAQQRETLLKEICDRTNLNTDQAESVLESISKPDGVECEGETSITTGDISADVSISASDNEVTNKYRQSGMALAQMLPNWRDLLRMAVSRVDTTDLDIETAWNTFQNFVGEDEAADFNIVALDAENYLREAPVYALEAETLTEEFAERIYDSEADPAAVAEQVAVLDESDFAQWLRSRGDLAEDAIEDLTDRLAAVRADVLEQVKEKEEKLSSQLERVNEPDLEVLSEEEQIAADKAIALLEEKLSSYFRYTTLSKLSAQSVEEKLHDLTGQVDGFSEQVERWQAAGAGLDLGAIAQTLSRRKGITDRQQRELMAALEMTWNGYRPLPESVSLSEKMTDYVQSIDWSEVDLDAFRDEVFQQVRAGVASTNGFAQSVDPGRLIATLDIPASVKSDLFELVKAEGAVLLNRPRRWARRISHTSQDWGAQLADRVGHYLASLDVSSRPEEMVREASRLVESVAKSIPVEEVPQLGADFWHRVLAYRTDLEEEEALSAASELTQVWQASVQALPRLKEQLKEQSVEQWQDVQAVAHSLSRFVNGEVLDPVLEAVPGLETFLEPTKQKFTSALDAAQDSFQRQRALVAQDLQRRAELVRRQVAIAAWWLFISLFASGAAAAGGGWLAVWVGVNG